MTTEEILDYVRTELSKIETEDMRRRRDLRSRETLEKMLLRGRLRFIIGDATTDHAVRLRAQAALEIIGDDL